MWVKVEVALPTLDDELARLRAIDRGIGVGKSPRRLLVRGAIDALTWIRDGGNPPHAAYDWSRAGD